MTTTPARKHSLPASSPFRLPLVRQGVKVILDGLAALLAWVVCVWVVHGGQPTLAGSTKWTLMALLISFAFQLTRQHYRLVGFQDAARLALATITLLTMGSLFTVLPVDFHESFNLQTVFASALTTGGSWLAIRGISRAYHERHLGTSLTTVGTVIHRALIVGAGRAGLMIAEELKRHPEIGSRIVGFVDDALDKQGIRIHGIPVLGPTRMLQQIIRQEGATQVVLAIPSAHGTVIRQLTEIIRSAGIEAKTVPGLFNLLGSRTWKPELQDVSIEDLLRREPVELDQSSLNLALEDSVVLITGGGGSIGGELARQVAAFRPARIVLLGRGENSLWETERSLRSLFPNQGLSLELCDIRNTCRLRQVFERWRPQVVLHAAAHKHVPYLEIHPEEAVDNNVFGTLNVIQASLEAGTSTFVNISTDKAVNPTNVLGATKRIAESVVLRAARQAPPLTRWVSVRFGNVLGSRGSVIPIFREQIRSGGPITVTHPEMTRYFMTIPEASQLVLQAGILGESAKVYVLDMSEPVRIMDLAADMARLSGLVVGQDIEIQFCGIRPGEKLYEELFSEQEQSHTEVHPKVFNADPETLDDEVLEEGLSALRLAILEANGSRHQEILRWLRRLVPSYAPSPTGLGRHTQETSDRRTSGAHPVYKPEALQA